jgi:haloalkane dehalogenase
MARAGVLADRAIAPGLADHAVARGPKGLGGIGYTNPLNPTDDAIDCYLSPLVSSPLRKAQLQAFTIALGNNSLAGTKQQLEQFDGLVRIVWGAADTVFAKSSPEWLNRTFRGSRGVRLVENGKLFFPEEQPDLVAAEARLLWNA